MFLDVFIHVCFWYLSQVHISVTIERIHTLQQGWSYDEDGVNALDYVSKTGRLHLNIGRVIEVVLLIMLNTSWDISMTVYNKK